MFLMPMRVLEEPLEVTLKVTPDKLEVGTGQIGVGTDDPQDNPLYRRLWPWVHIGQGRWIQVDSDF